MIALTNALDKSRRNHQDQGQKYSAIALLEQRRTLLLRTGRGIVLTSLVLTGEPTHSLYPYENSLTAILSSKKNKFARLGTLRQQSLSTYGQHCCSSIGDLRPI